MNIDIKERPRLLRVEELEDRRLLAAVAHDGSDIVYHLQRRAEETVIARYAVSTDSQLADISIARSASSIGYSSSNHQLYIGHSDSTISSLDLSLDQPSEVNFAALESNPITDIIAVGDIVFAGSRNSRTTLDSAGAILDQDVDDNRAYSYVYSAVRDSLYFVDSSGSISFAELDEITGEISTPSELSIPHMGTTSTTYNTQFVVTADGALLLDNSGDIYSADSLEYIGTIPTHFLAMVTLPDGSFVTSQTVNGETRLEQWNSERTQVNFRIIPGLVHGLTVVGDVVVAITRPNDVGGVYSFSTYLPTNDADGDGIPMPADAFPHDVAASIDTDQDGRPDDWNVGYSGVDSQTDLQLDVFPFDSACQEASDAVPDLPSECDLTRIILAPDWVDVDSNGIVYLLDADQAQIGRWSIPDQNYQNPIILSDEPEHVALDAQSNRLFVSYANRIITKLELSDFYPVEQRVVASIAFPDALVTSDDTLFILGDRFVSQFYTDGSRKAEFPSVSARETDVAWSSTNSRLFIASGTSIHSYDVDSETGEASNYQTQRTAGFSSTEPFVRVARDGGRALASGGSMHDAATLELLERLDDEVHDARWLSDGTVVMLSGYDSSKLLHATENLVELNLVTFDGILVGIVDYDDNIIAVHSVDGELSFEIFVPTTDVDGDGVPTVDDDFPYDPSASLDTDGDEFPDHWNEGAGPEDSTSGLMLDAFPIDRACQTPEHAVPGRPDVCDFANGVANIVPIKVVQEAGIAYLHDRTSHQIDRWSLAEQRYLEPIYLSHNPIEFAVSRQLNQLLVADWHGRLTTIDLDASPPVEVAFADLLSTDHLSLSHIDTAWTVTGRDHLQVYSTAGEQLERIEFKSHSYQFTWSASLGRLYFVENGRSYDPTEVSWYSVDPNTSELGSATKLASFETAALGPVAFSPDHSQLLLTNGAVLDATTLQWIQTIPVGTRDAVWLADDRIITTRWSSQRTEFTHWATDRVTALQSWTVEDVSKLSDVTTYNGDVFFLSANRVEPPRYVRHELNRDADGDGVLNVDDHFPNDAAAWLDSDGDAWPDEWTVGYGTDDSTTGLRLDAFPTDSICQTPGHALPMMPLTCNIDGRIAQFESEQTVVSPHIIFFLDRETEQIHRWSIQTEKFLNPILLDGHLPRMIEYDALHDRLLIAGRSFTILEIGPSEYHHKYLTRAPARIDTLIAADDHVVAFTSMRAAYVFGTSGELKDSLVNAGRSEDIYWDASRRRLIAAGYPSAQVHSINAMGKITRVDDSFGRLSNPISSVSPNDNLFFDRSGALHDAASLGRLQVPFFSVDPQSFAWWNDTSVATISQDGDATRLDLWDEHFVRLVSEPVLGLPITVEIDKNRLIAVTQDVRPVVQFFPLVEDHDGDGVPTTEDAFPQDASASSDFDRDGYPDEWNLGSGEGDTTTGLVLDAFPADSACYDPSHQLVGSSACDTSTGVSELYPTELALVDSVIFMLSPTDHRLHRWDTDKEAYLNPIVTQLAPSDFTYSAPSNRIFVSYANGNINYIDLDDAEYREEHFAATAEEANELVATGSFITVALTDRLHSLQVFDLAGVQKSVTPFHGDSVNWNEHLKRLYLGGSFFLDSWQLDSNLGVFGEPLSSDHRVGSSARLAISDDGQIVTRSGQFWDADFQQLENDLPDHVDAVWNDEGHLIYLAHSGFQSVVEKTDVETFEDYGEEVYYHTRPMRVFADGNVAHVVARSDDGLRFFQFTTDNRDGVRQNIQAPTDVDDDGVVSPVDALLVINALPGTGLDRNNSHFYDVDRDSAVSPLDALLVINALNDSSANAAAVNRETSNGESLDAKHLVRDFVISMWDSNAKGDEDEPSLFASTLMFEEQLEIW